MKEYKVYRNLHNGKLSIKEVRSGLVVGHCDAIKLANVTFKVSEAGVSRIRRDKRKSVVATVNGVIASITGFTGFRGRDAKVYDTGFLRSYIPTKRVYFNPYKHTSFVSGVGHRIDRSDFTVIESNGVMLAL